VIQNFGFFFFAISLKRKPESCMQAVVIFPGFYKDRENTQLKMISGLEQNFEPSTTRDEITVTREGWWPPTQLCHRNTPRTPQCLFWSYGDSPYVVVRHT